MPTSQFVLVQKNILQACHIFPAGGQRACTPTPTSCSQVSSPVYSLTERLSCCAYIHYAKGDTVLTS